MDTSGEIRKSLCVLDLINYTIYPSSLKFLELNNLLHSHVIHIKSFLLAPGKLFICIISTDTGYMGRKKKKPVHFGHNQLDNISFKSEILKS